MRKIVIGSTGKIEYLHEECLKIKEQEKQVELMKSKESEKKTTIICGIGIIIIMLGLSLFYLHKFRR